MQHLANGMRLRSRRTPPVQKHLEKVYTTLAAALLLSAFGVWINLTTGLGGNFIGVAGFVGCATWLSVSDASPYNLNKRCPALPMHGYVLAPPPQHTNRCTVSTCRVLSGPHPVGMRCWRARRSLRA